MKKELIVTHPGSAHFDEVTAISLILAIHPDTDFRVERRDPVPAELDDPQTWVVDTGRRHEPEKRNFDHHQSLDSPASFVLVADYLGLLDTLSVMPWWDFKDYVDRIGPVRASEKFNAGDDLVNRNPMEDWIVDQFVADPASTLSILKSYGAFIIASAQKLKRQIDYWKKSRRLTINGVPAVIGETRESFGLEEYRRLEKNPPDIVISMDRRSDGWRLFRYEGAPVDFRLIANCSEVEFAHMSGFLAKTKEHLPVDQLIALVSKAVVRE